MTRDIFESDCSGHQWKPITALVTPANAGVQLGKRNLEAGFRLAPE